MGNLKINYALTVSTGRELLAKGAEFDSVLRKIKSINNELQGAWQGSDAAKYTEKINAESVDMQKLSEAISEIGNFLVKVGNAYEQAMQANRSAIE